MTAARRLGRYRVGERIGTGGVADVFLAETEGAQGFAKTVVLKCLRPHVADIPEVARALAEEAKLAQRLQHGNVVQVFDFAVDGDVPYVVMEHVDGCTLRELMRDLERRDEPVPLPVALLVAEHVATALSYAHGLADAEGMPLDVVHRDVKPSNILLSRDGLVKLTDFGVAKVADRGTETLPGVLKGTPTYWAPEQAAGQPVDARADVYGLGIVLDEMLGPVPTQDERVDDELRALVAEARAELRAQRLESMEALVTKLRRWCAAHDVTPSAKKLGALVRRARKDKPLAIRVALDTALLPSAKGDATVQHLPEPQPAEPPRRRLGWMAGAAVAIALGGWAAWSFSSPATGSEASTAERVTSRSEASAVEASTPARTVDESAGHASTPALPRAGKIPARPAADGGAADDDDDTAPVGDEAAAGPGADDAGAVLPDAPPDSDGDEPGADGDEAGDAAAPTPTAAKKTKPRPRARMGTLSINVVPYALVTIDGVDKGQTPVKATVGAGSHTVVLEHPTMGSRTRKVQVGAGDVETITRW